jgi:hypothetical protein
MAELAFFARAALLGFKVSKPYTDCIPYDLIVGHEFHLYRVQVKSTMHYDPLYDRYKCQVAPPSRPGMYSPRELDFIAAYIIPKDLWYIIPIHAVRGRIISLSPDQPRNRYHPYRERWELLMAPPAVPAQLLL